jgi:hypothetical protein
LKAKFTLQDRIYYLVALIIFFLGYYLLLRLGKWATIGILLVALSLYFGIKGGFIFSLKNKEKDKDK